MTLTLLLPWFPILLGVGVGGRLLGRGRGMALGLVCAMFWIVLVQASAGTDMWSRPWVVLTIVMGAGAIFLMGGWAGQMPLKNDAPSSASSVSSGSAGGHSTDDASIVLDQIATVIDQFDDWLVNHRDDANPWPEFGEFIRGVLFQCCEATHVRAYRLLSEGNELVPLCEADSSREAKIVSARQGLLGHVITTGRSYVAGQPTHGNLIGQLAQGCPETTTWCFAVTSGAQKLGVVASGQLGVSPLGNSTLLRALEQLIGQCWRLLAETVHSNSLSRDDPGSGLLNRTALFHAARQSLQESYSLGEPVAVAVFAVEGVRELNDSGQWEDADALVRNVADCLRAKIRMDDRLGRFDGSRFVWLLRRVDAELATLIVKQVMSRLTALCGGGRSPAVFASVAVRCGVVGSGTDNPDLQSLIIRALAQCRRARLEQTAVACELDAPVAALTSS